MSPASELCALCCRPATGHAYVNDDRYCHGDGDPEPTCYQQAMASTPWPLADGWRLGSTPRVPL